MKCLIIAAEKGSRVRKVGDNKPLVPLLGVNLIERVIRTALEAGVDEFYVVIGYQEERVRAFLGRLAERLRIPIMLIVNEDWENEEGLSLLKAQEYLLEPFLLLMAHHLFDPSIAREMMAYPPAEGEITVAIDGDTRNSCIDIEDVTRARTEGGKIRDIGDELADFNGFDTGILMCTSTIFEALNRSAERYGETTLSGAVRILAAEGRAKAVDVSGHFWINVTNPAAFKRAENALMVNLRGKPSDGPVFRYFYRPLSGMISRWLVKFGITPNQISLSSFLISVLAAGLFALGGYATLLLGGFLAQFAMVIDCCDGTVARLKFQISDYGGWFDAVLDRYADAFLLFGLMWHAYAEKMHNLILFTGFMAIIGSFVLSYTADKYDSLMRDRIGQGKELRVGRELRVFLIFLGALFDQVYLTLVVIAFLMNIETIRRIIICRNHG